jgi:hypothetical protein
VTNVSPTPTRNVPGVEGYRKEFNELTWDNPERHDRWSSRARLLMQLASASPFLQRS